MTDLFSRSILRFSVVAFLVVVFLAVSHLGLIDPLHAERVGLVMQAVLYLLSLPTGLILRLDQWHEFFPHLSGARLLIGALFLVFLNFLALAALRRVICRSEISANRGDR